jgi:hypothetical protein
MRVRQKKCLNNIEFIINEEVTVKVVEAPAYHSESNDVAVTASVK